MRHLIQNTPTCLLYSAAMVMDCDPQDIADFIGHDGTESHGRLTHVGINIQEIQDYALSIGHHYYLIQPMPCQAKDGIVKPVYEEQEAINRFFLHLGGKKGILIGKVRLGSEDHAVAFDDLVCYDPNGGTYGIGSFHTMEAWIYV
jgi:hypothetical protein